jgi:hypothetical protein
MMMHALVPHVILLVTSVVKVRFQTAVRTWTIMNWTKSPVQGSWKSWNQTHGPVPGLGLSCFSWTGLSGFEPVWTMWLCWLPTLIIIDFPHRLSYLDHPQPTSAQHQPTMMSHGWNQWVKPVPGMFPSLFSSHFSFVLTAMSHCRDGPVG